jgi:hypothetical protein
MMMKWFAAVTIGLLLSAGFVSAGPIVPKDIDANAKWFGHLNCEAIHSLKLVQDLQDKCPVYHRCQAKMEELAKKLGMNPLKDVLGATLYGDRYGGHCGVVLIYVKNLDREKMLGFFEEKHPNHTTSDYGSRKLYGWTAKHHGKTMDLSGAFASDTLIVIGTGIEQVKAALDVLDGKKPGLAKNASLLKDVPENALCAARGIDVPEDFRKTSRCPILHNCRSASAVWSEKDGQITGKHEFTTVSAEAAKNFKASLEGLKAMAELRYGDVSGVKKLLDGLTCSADGDSFTAAFTVSSEDVEAAAKAFIERRKARKHPDESGTSKE